MSYSGSGNLGGGWRNDSGPNRPHAFDPWAQPELFRGVLTRRVFAFLIDLVVLSVPVIFGYLFIAVFGLITLGLGWPLFGLLPAIPLLYHWLFLASGMAATPGQAMMGIGVRQDFDLAPPSGLQALVFTVLFYVTIMTGVIWMAVALFTALHRTIHDMISGLVVVRTRALTPPPRF